MCEWMELHTACADFCSWMDLPAAMGLPGLSFACCVCWVGFVCLCTVVCRGVRVMSTVGIQLKRIRNKQRKVQHFVQEDCAVQQ